MNYLRRPPRSRTRDRIAAMRRLTVLLANGEMRLDEIVGVMRISPSCSRKYLNALIDGEIVELARREHRSKFGHVGQPVYKLIATREQIEQFLAEALIVVPSTEEPLQQGDACRRIHIPVGARWASVMRDPLALPLEFFRAAQSANEVLA